jgi:hypothetical protein
MASRFKAHTPHMKAFFMFSSYRSHCMCFSSTTSARESSRHLLTTHGGREGGREGGCALIEKGKTTQMRILPMAGLKEREFSNQQHLIGILLMGERGSI